MISTRRHVFSVFDVVNTIILGVMCLTIIVPFDHLLSISLSPSWVATKGGLHLWPVSFTIQNYQQVIRSRLIWVGYRNTLIRTVLGTAMQLFATSLGAYVLSKRYYPHRAFWTLFIVFTMFFSGGMIPSYLLMKNLHLFDNYLVLVLPGLVSAYNLVLMRNFFTSLPEELEESGLIDGAGRFTIFMRIVLPCSAPILATIGLWLAVGHWNAWFDALMYMRDANKFVLQIVLRRIILEGTQQMLELNPGALTNETPLVSPDGLKAASVFVATLPIICVYPFIQKYFVKGIMVGSLKG
ncbi:sugar ABC transporter permease [Clostridia bacterium]|nr:sugar ABC transporter permease [Clostridia bacterium]